MPRRTPHDLEIGSRDVLRDNIDRIEPGAFVRDIEPVAPITLRGHRPARLEKLGLAGSGQNHGLQAGKEAHYLGNVANFARHASTNLVFIIIGIVCAISLFFNSRLDLFRESHAVPNNLYSVCCDEISARFRDFYHSFSTVIGAQMTISCINTILTAIFVLVFQMPYAPVLVGLTFLCGLFPIVGNVVSNTVIVFVGFQVSPRVAIGALVFLIVIHKLEYLLNSKIIGARIRNPIWLTLIGLIIGERLMGVPGMILSAVVLNYLRVEMSKKEVKGILQSVISNR